MWYKILTGKSESDSEKSRNYFLYSSPEIIKQIMFTNTLLFLLKLIVFPL